MSDDLTFGDTEEKKDDLSFDTDKGDQKGDSEDTNMLKKRLSDKDAFIEELKKENQAARELLAQQDSVLKSQDSIASTLERIQQASATKNEEQTTPVVDVDEVTETARKKILDELSEREQQAQQVSNLRSAHQALQEQYGDKYKEVVQNRAKELGMSLNEVDRMGRTSPNALVSLMRGQQGSTPAPSSGTVSGVPGNSQESFDKFTKIYKEDRNAFYQPDVQKAYRNAILEKAKKEGRLS